MAERISRWSTEDRRQSVLDEASTVFAREGYRGATTDRIAKAAGISQPYVVRMFGSKEALFLEVLQRCLDDLLQAFRTALAEPGVADAVSALSTAYQSLAVRDGVHLLLMQAFLLGADPVVGPAARHGFQEIVALLRNEAALSEEQLQAFLARGMLVNVLLGLRMPGADGSDAVAAALSLTADR